MKKRFPTLLLLALTVVSWSSAQDNPAQVQIALYPYFQHPETGWRVTILADGTVRYEESAVPIKSRFVTSEDATPWVEQPQNVTTHLSPRKHRRLLAQLRTLQLGGLQPRYSAEFSYIDSASQTRVVNESGELLYTKPAQAWVVVTHDATYRLCISVDDLFVDSSVYAPFHALASQTPKNPDRVGIANIISAWRYVLKATGSVNGFKAKMFRQAIE